MVIAVGVVQIGLVPLHLGQLVWVELFDLVGHLIGDAQQQGVDHVVLPDDGLPDTTLVDQGEVQQETLEAQKLVQLLAALFGQGAQTIPVCPFVAAAAAQGLSALCLHYI